MQTLASFLDSHYSAVEMDLRDRNWVTASGIPNEAGWYFVTTSTPIEVLQRQSLWSDTYTKKKEQKIAPVRNYNIAARAKRYNADLSTFWCSAAVYSGFASSIRARAKEHTFPDPGTAGLALSMYPDLRAYVWAFHFITLSRFKDSCSSPDMVLHLGEQIWRSKNGWPILCAE